MTGGTFRVRLPQDYVMTVCRPLALVRGTAAPMPRETPEDRGFRELLQDVMDGSLDSAEDLMNVLDTLKRMSDDNSEG